MRAPSCSVHHGPGTYRLEVTRLGYALLTTDTVHVGWNQNVHVTLRIGVSAIPLAPLTVTARARSSMHDATYDGLYSRRAVALPVGNARVWVKGDRDFESSIRASDLLRQVKPRATVWVRNERAGETWPEPCQPLVFWHGFLVMNSSLAELQLDRSIDDLEGVEIYRDYTSIPFDFRLQLDPGMVRFIRECGAVALWPRRPDYPRR